METSKILSQIAQIRGEAAPDFVDGFDCRGVFVRESDRMCAYLYNTPIYRTEDGMLPDFRFYKSGGRQKVRLCQAESQIVAGDGWIALERPCERYVLEFADKTPWKRSGEALTMSGIRLLPTAYGVMICADIAAGREFSATLSADTSHRAVQKNSQYFSFMAQKFKPAMTLSSLFLRGEDGGLYPLTLLVREVGAERYALEWRAPVSMSGQVVFEWNLYEEKLVQDTTVSALLARENNAFGSAAFLGQSEPFGEVHLYSKLAYYRKVLSIRLLVPRLSSAPFPVEAYLMEERFCSIGSTWENKIPHSVRQLPAEWAGDYLAVDLSSAMCPAGKLLRIPGILLKMPENTAGYGVLATGDSCAFPQILEITYAR